MKSIRIALVLAIFIILSSLVSANLGYYSESNSLKACACSDITDVLKIKNTGSQITTYYIAVDQDFVSISNSEFSLLPGEIQDIDVLITAPCETGAERIRFIITSSVGDLQFLEKELVSGRCQNLFTGLNANKNETISCNSIDYELFIENTGTFDETYLINPVFKYGSIKSTASEVNLSAGESTVVNIKTTPLCQYTGPFESAFYVSSKNNQLTALLKHSFYVHPEYDYSFSVDDEVEFCTEDDDIITVEIENEENFNNTYYLSLIGANFARLSQSSIDIEGGDSVEVNISLGNKPVGEYNITLKVKSLYGEEEKTQIINVKINDCYNYKITLNSDSAKFCSGEKTLVATVENLGSERVNIDLESNFDWAEFEDDSLNLNSGEQEEVILNLNPEDLDAKYFLEVKAILEEGSQDFVESDSAVLKVLSQSSCYYVSILDNQYSIRRHSQNKTIIKFTNKGLESAKYFLEMDSDSWFKLDESEMSLQPGESKWITLWSKHTSETPFGDYPINITISKQGINQPSYEKEIIISLKDKTICTKSYEYFSANPCHLATVVLIVAIIILLIIFLVVKKIPRKLRKTPFSILVLVLIVVAILFAVFVYNEKGSPYLNQPIDKSKINSTNYIWWQNTNYHLPMSEIVSDPDADDLNIYFLTEFKEVNMSMIDDEIIFEPQENWVGSIKVMIVAEDYEGAKAVSPEITLQVLQKNNYSLWQAYNKLCWYFNWVLMVIAFVFFVLIGYKKIRSKPRVLKKTSRKKK